MTIETTLAAREATYGLYSDVSEISQQLKKTFHGSVGWKSLRPDMQESLDLIANKIARILNGDPTYKDNWHDIIGYAKLVEVTLE